jgi:hypothetical protein
MFFFYDMVDKGSFLEWERKRITVMNPTPQKHLSRIQTDYR